MAVLKNDVIYFEMNRVKKKKRCGNFWNVSRIFLLYYSLYGTW